MNTTYIILMVAIWFTVGTGSFIYWWTRDHDFILGVEVLLAFACGILGPFAFLAGWSIHGGKKFGEPPVIVKKRTGEGRMLQKMKGWTKGPKEE